MRWLLPAFLLVVAGCAGLGAPGPQTLGDTEIAADTVWQGRVVIDGAVKVAKGATLTIRPGTEVAFVRRDADGDGLGDGTLIVEGGLVARGTRAAPIVFRSAAADPAPGDWLEIRADFCRNLRLRYCRLRDSAYTLHAHFSRVVVEDCTIADNIDGCRLGQGKAAIRNCLIENNRGKGINFRNTTVEATGNIIRRNGSGIFIFETDRPSDIRGNNIYANLENVRLGDFFTGDVRLEGNWWGNAAPEPISAGIYDARRDPALGRVFTRPRGEWVAGSGPRDELAGLAEVWSRDAGGFVDAGPLAAANGLVTVSWDGSVTRLDRDGRTVWSRVVGDVVDGRPAGDGSHVFVQTWSRQVFALDAVDGTVRWRFGYPPSPADDHRQGGLVRVADLLLVPAWNGTLYALDPADGLVRWSRPIGLPLRAAPVCDGERIYQASGAGRLAALDLEGNLLWQATVGAPVLAAPALTPDGPVVLDKAGRLTAFDRQGNRRWQRNLQAACFYGAPVAAGKALVVTTAGGDLWKLDADSGVVVWRLGGLGPLYGTPRVADGRIYVGDNDGVLHVVGLDSGDPLARAVIGREIQGTPLLLGDRLFVGARDHSVHAFDLCPAATESAP